jgi:rhodanese-related sulfurtransferase
MRLFTRIESVDARTALTRIAAGEAILLDVREQAEWNSEHVGGSLHIPLSRLRSRLDDLPRETTIIAACRSGHRSAVAARTLTRAGYSTANLRGGLSAWKRAGLPPAVTSSSRA